MKKLVLIGVGFALAIAVFGAAGFAYAQTQVPPEPRTSDAPEFPYGRAGWSRGTHGSMVGGQNDTLGGMMVGLGFGEDQPGLLHDYLWPAIAEAFNLTDAQIEAFEIVRQTLQEIRADLTQDEIQDTMKQAMSTAIENALADGAITEEQAEAWLERLAQMEAIFPGMPVDGRGRAGIFRDGFSTGVKFSRPMMLYHVYLDAAIADALDISVDEFQEMRAEEGFNWKKYVDELGLSDEESAALLQDIFSDAVEAALEDDAITQEQADWMLEYLENSEGRGVWFGQP